MKLKTSSNKEYEVDWIGESTFLSGNVVLQMQDKRPLHEIAAEFNGLEWMERESEKEGNKRFEEYSVVQSIQRRPNGEVLISFSKG